MPQSTIIHDLRINLEKQDYKVIAEIIREKQIANVDAPAVAAVIAAPGTFSNDTVEGQIRIVTKFYLSLKDHHKNAVKAMKELVDFNSRDFFAVLSKASRESDHHIQELSRNSWY